MENLIIDQDAKSKVELIKVNRETTGKEPYFIGKLQFPGTLDFELGASFMVFIAENGMEELQIAPIDPSRFSKTSRSNGAFLGNGKISVDLHPMIDHNGATYYVGEVLGLSKIDLRTGIFFNIFTSIPGREQIQISRLQHKARIKHEDSRSNNTFDPKKFSDNDL